MQISGPGITPFNTFIKTFKIKTTLALKWNQLSNKNYVAIDRGITSDIYSSKIKIVGLESDINDFIDEIELNRQNGSNVITLGSFNDEEIIFGANVDYSGTIDCTITKFEKRAQKSLQVFTWGFEVVAINSDLSYVGTPGLPELTPLYGYKGYSSWELNKQDSYEGDYSYHDMNSDIGRFEGNFVLCFDDIKNFRNYIFNVKRGDDVTITSSDLLNVAYPFGPKRGTFPFNCKVLQFDDQQIDLKLWSLKLVLSEIYSGLQPQP